MARRIFRSAAEQKIDRLERLIPKYLSRVSETKPPGPKSGPYALFAWGARKEICRLRCPGRLDGGDARPCPLCPFLRVLGESPASVYRRTVVPEILRDPGPEPPATARTADVTPDVTT